MSTVLISQDAETLTLFETSINLMIDDLVRTNKWFPIDKSEAFRRYANFGVTAAGSVSLITKVIYISIFLKFYIASESRLVGAVLLATLENTLLLSFCSLSDPSSTKPLKARDQSQHRNFGDNGHNEQTSQVLLQN